MIVTDVILGHAARILIVDDERSSRDLLKVMLGRVREMLAG